MSQCSILCKTPLSLTCKSACATFHRKWIAYLAAASRSPLARARSRRPLCNVAVSFLAKHESVGCNPNSEAPLAIDAPGAMELCANLAPSSVDEVGQWRDRLPKDLEALVEAALVVAFGGRHRGSIFVSPKASES